MDNILMNTTAPNILIADDHPLFREAMSSIVCNVCPNSTIDYAANAEDTAKKLSEATFYHLILLDFFMPGAKGFSCIEDIVRTVAPSTILVVSSYEDPMVIAKIKSIGLLGFLPKSSPLKTMEVVIQNAIEGKTYFPKQGNGVLGNEKTGANNGDFPFDPTETLNILSPRQAGVLKFLAAGKTNKQIANTLGISDITAKAHVSAILKKLQVTNRLQAAMIGHKLDQLGYL